MKNVYPTIDEIVFLFHPNYVSVNNPKIKGVPTKGDALVYSFKVEYDEADGTHMYIDIL